MTNYVWSVSAGGTITAGGTATSSTVTVTWNTAGPQSVSVNYDNAGGCTAATATVMNVQVDAVPTPTLTGGLASACLGASVTYTTEAGMTNYAWIVSSGGTITAGGTPTSNTATVTWNTVGPQSVSVNYDNAGGCDAPTATSRTINVDARPTPTLIGPAAVCADATGVTYTTDAGMTNYTWTVVGGLVTAGGTGNFVTVTWPTHDMLSRKK